MNRLVSSPQWPPHSGLSAENRRLKRGRGGRAEDNRDNCDKNTVGCAYIFFKTCPIRFLNASCFMVEGKYNCMIQWHCFTMADLKKKALGEITGAGNWWEWDLSAAVAQLEKREEKREKVWDRCLDIICLPLKHPFLTSCVCPCQSCN